VADPGTLRVLLNAHAGPRRQADEARLDDVLSRQGIQAAIEAVEPRDLMDALTRLAGEAMVGVAGGDGTLRTAARALAGSSTVLVPFPTGTLNHFARRLGIDTIEAAAGAVRGGAVRELPVGRANDHVFLNTAVIGAYPRLVELRQRFQPYLTKWPAAALAATILLARLPHIRLTARMPETDLDARTAMFWVGVGRGSFPAVHETPSPTRARLWRRWCCRVRDAAPRSECPWPFSVTVWATTMHSSAPCTSSGSRGWSSLSTAS
jgi:diacylglycerol kinase family enzyme